MVVARAGERADPPVAAPAALRPFLNFTRFNDRAADAVRRVIETDEAFRARVRDAVVASAVDEEAAGASVGEAGWLLLDRPEGSVARLDALLDEALEARVQEEQRRDERRNAKRRAQAEAALADVRAELAGEQERGVERDAELDAAHEELRTLRAAVEAHAGEAARLAGERAEAVRQLDEARRTVEERAEERRALRRGAADAREDAAALRIEVAHLRTELESMRSLPLLGRPEPAPAPDAATGFVRDELVGAVGEAAAAAQALGEALARAAGALEASVPTDTDTDTHAGAPPRAGRAGRAASPGGRPTDVAPPGGSSAGSSATGTGATGRGAIHDADDGATARGAGGGAAAAGGGEGSATAAPDRGGVPVRRHAARIPVGIYDDSSEAADHLARLPGAVLVVDGYNVSLGAWPDQALAQQRRRLVEALRNLQARTGVEPVAVFDGGEVDSGPTGSLPRSVQVRFSPPGVTADDVVVQLVSRYPNDRAVVVATSDRELQHRVRSIGANVISSPQLVSILQV